ncbi:MAG: sugar porter family MFS transporter, partial [Steroidobacteraceae bacterium]
FTMFLIARVCSGLAVGAAILTAPVYIAEIAPASRRGSLVSLNQLMIVIGISASFFSNYFLLSTGNDNWRWMLGVQAVPALLFLLMLLTVPESPRWLFGKGQGQQALAILSSLHGGAEALDELGQIRANLGTAPAASLGSRLRGVFSARLRFVLLFAIGIAFFQQITGINAIFYYLPTIFAQAGGGLATAFAQSVVVGLVNVGMTVVAIRLIDRIGRRPLLITGVSGMAIALLSIAWAFNAAPASAGAAPMVNAPLVLCAIVGFVACFAISLGPVMWVMLAEIFPNEQRATAISAVGFWNSLVSASVTLIFPWELQRLGPAGTFLGYGLMAVAGLVFLATWTPETKGKTLEELEGALMRAPT